MLSSYLLYRVVETTTGSHHFRVLHIVRGICSSCSMRIIGDSAKASKICVTTSNTCIIQNKLSRGCMQGGFDALHYAIYVQW